MAALEDTPIRITLGRFLPGEDVNVTAELTDRAGRRWRSSATFVADRSGAIDVERTAPREGSYTSISPMGLIWSMKLVAPAGAAPRKGIQDPITIDFAAEGEHSGKAQTAATRFAVAPGVKAVNVRQASFAGTLFRPADETRFRAIVVLSERADARLAEAALFASHGYAALAVANFGASTAQAGVPIESFGAAIQWLKTAIPVRGNAVGVVGHGRGAEAGLLVATHYPADVSAVVGWGASGVVDRTLPSAQSDEGAIPGDWTFSGHRILSLWDDNQYAAEAEAVWRASLACPPVDATQVRQIALRDRAAVERAMIAVERSEASILLISGKDDRVRPAFELSQMVMRRLEEHRHPWPYQHVTYEDAGHLIGPPFGPTTHLAHRELGTNVRLAAGGTPEGCARANDDAWRTVLGFLHGAIVRRAVRASYDTYRTRPI